MKNEEVKGKILNIRDLVEWNEAKYITFLRFCELFINYDGEVPKLSVTKERWLSAEKTLDQEDHPFNEFLFRINVFSWNTKATPKTFYYRFILIMRGVLSYLKANPSLISPAMYKIIESNPRFNWCLKQTKIETTAAGVDIIVPDREEHLTETRREVKGLIPYEQQLAEAMIKTTNLLSRVVDSITVKDIKAMKPSEKITAVGRLGFIFSMGMKFKPAKQIFKQMNITNASVEEMEKAMLDFSKDE